MLKVISRVARRVALLAVLPLVLAGCFRVDLAISVNDDGSGTMNMLVAFDQGLLDLMQGAGGTSGSGDEPATTNPLDLFGGLDTASLPPGVTVEPYSEDNYVGARISVPFAATDDVAATLDEAFAAMGDSGPLSGESATPLEGLVLRKEDNGGWHFEAGTTSPTDGQTDDLTSGLAQTMLAGATFTVRLRLPGDVIETNADEQTADGELIWNIDPSGDDRTLLARTEPAGGGGANVLLIAGLVIATVVVVGGLGYYVRRPVAPPSAGDPPVEATGGE